MKSMDNLSRVMFSHMTATDKKNVINSFIYSHFKYLS